MVSVVDILKYALTHFYPRSRKSVDGVEYKSLKETYKDWFNSKYVNGYWFINVEEKDIPPVLNTIDRSFGNTVYMVYNGTRWYFGFLMNNFDENQMGKCHVYYDNDYVYNASFKKHEDGYGLVALASQITNSNVNRFVFSADETVTNRVKFTGVNNFVVTDIVEIGYSEFNELKRSNAPLPSGNDYTWGVLTSPVFSYSNGSGKYDNNYVQYDKGVLNFN